MGSIPSLVKPKTIKLVFVKHAALRRKSKDWLAHNHDNVFEWSDMSTHRLLFQWASTIKLLKVVYYVQKPWHLSNLRHSVTSYLKGASLENLFSLLRKISFLYIFKNNTMFYRLSSENVWQRKKKEKQQQNFLFIATEKHIVGVMVSMLTCSAVDRGFEPQSGRTKDY